MAHWLTFGTRWLAMAMILSAGVARAQISAVDFRPDYRPDLRPVRVPASQTPPPRPTLPTVSDNQLGERYSLDRYLVRNASRPAVAPTPTPAPAVAQPANLKPSKPPTYDLSGPPIFVISGGVFVPTPYRTEAEATPANKDDQAWQYWVNRRNAVTNSYGPDDPTNDCPACKDQPRPRKCCGKCGRVNDCELCLTGDHALPGDRTAAKTVNSSSLPFIDKNNNCPACRTLQPPRNCCGKCGRAHECPHCANGVHAPGGGLLRDNRLNKDLVRTQRPDGDSGTIRQGTKEVNNCPACRTLLPPRNCCGVCGRPHECQHCANGVHAPGGRPLTRAKAQTQTAPGQNVDWDKYKSPTSSPK